MSKAKLVADKVFWKAKSVQDTKCSPALATIFYPKSGRGFGKRISAKSGLESKYGTIVTGVSAKCKYTAALWLVWSPIFNMNE